MSNLAEYWDSVEVARDLFKVLLRERYTNTYRIFNDGNLVKSFVAESDKDAIEIFRKEGN